MAEGVAYLFAGQGAQFVGMGRQLYHEFPVVRETFAAAEEILGRSLARLCFDGPDETLTATRNAQPAVFTLGVGVWELLRQEGLRPAAAAGHSLGEYSALVCAGALDFQEGLRLVSLRGELMERACQSRPGTMAAILGLDDEPVVAICEVTGATAANFNCPGQVVISGPADAVAKTAESAREQGGKVISLAVSGAFHSPLMESAQERLAEALRDAAIFKARIPVYCNVDALPHEEAEEFRHALSRQVTSSVLWKQSLANMGRNGGVGTFVEVGSEKTLGGMAKRTLPGAQVLAVWDTASLKTVLARLGGR